ncbi:hypothetical protein JW964_15090 [candidate division KSB1 bacterium]|nr:hypothetical protein [candidate division KSB1 bacterium]
MFFRFIFWILIFYLLYYLFKNFLIWITDSLIKNPDKNMQIKGEPKAKPPLDLSNRDVEDARFHEIEKDKKNQ